MTMVTAGDLPIRRPLRLRDPRPDEERDTGISQGNPIAQAWQPDSEAHVLVSWRCDTGGIRGRCTLRVTIIMIALPI